MNIGFTGTQNGMNERQLRILRSLLEEYERKNMYNEFHHGDCIGADLQASKLADMLGFKIICHPPENKTKRGFNRYDEIRIAKPYLERNHDIVNESLVLIATPATNTEVLRSGTWATIRYARKKKIEVIIINPNET